MRILALLLVLLQSASSSAQDLGPEELVRKLASEFMEITQNDKLMQGGDRRAIGAVFDKKLVPMFDFQEAARIAVGTAWRTASLEQQERIVKEFRSMIVRVYSNVFGTYPGQSMRVEPLKLPPGATAATVRGQHFRAGRPPIPIHVATHKTAAGWRIFDINVEGVSVLLTYRSEFELIVKESGIEGLIRRITEKNLPPVEK